MTVMPVQVDLLYDPRSELRPPAFADGRQGRVVARPIASSRLLRYGLITLVCLPIQMLLHRIASRRIWERFCRWYHARALAAFNIKIVERGVQSSARPTLFVANHNSYLDIEVLGARILGTFIAMEQVARWPLFGLLSKLQDTVFIDRQTKSIAQQQQQITARFDQRQNLVMFPEGSSYTSTHLLAFRSSLFAVARHRVEGQPVTVQPVSVTFAKLDNLPLGRGLRSIYGWYGDSPLGPHIATAAGTGRLTVVLEWHPPKTLDDFEGDRKALSAYCESMIKAGMAQARRT